MWRIGFLLVVAVCLVGRMLASASTLPQQEVVTSYEGTLPEYGVTVTESREANGNLTLVVSLRTASGIAIEQTLAGMDEPKGPVYCGNAACSDQTLATGAIRMALEATYDDAHVVRRLSLN